MRVIRILSDRCEVVEIEPTLSSLQKEVQGHIDIVNIIPHQLVMIVNEEGLLLDLDLNPGASWILQRVIVGNVIVVGIDQRDPTDLDDIPDYLINPVLMIANYGIQYFKRGEKE